MVSVGTLPLAARAVFAALGLDEPGTPGCAGVLPSSREETSEVGVAELSVELH